MSRRCGSRIDTREAHGCGLSRAPATTVSGLSRLLQRMRRAGTREPNRTSRAERRLRGKDDQLDAVRAARSALASKQRATPRGGQHQEALRLLLLARRSAVDARRVALVQLRSVVVTAPDELRGELRRLPLGELLKRCSRFRRSNSRTPDQLATILVLRTLARRIQTATDEAETLEREILTHVRQFVPHLLDEPGVGPIVAAQLIVAWSHRDRVRSEAAFARLAGAAPSRPRAARPSAIASAAAATANSTVPSTRSSSTADSTTPPPATTSPAASPTAKDNATRPASSSATSPATSTASCRTRRPSDDLTVIGDSFPNTSPGENSVSQAVGACR